MKLSLSKDCGNSPKNRFVQDLAIALELGDARLLGSAVTEDVRWEVVGEDDIVGRDDFLRRISSQKSRARSLEIDRVLSHGRSGAVNGIVVLGRKAERSFCHMFEFSNAKGVAVRRITSYRVDR